MHNDSASVRWWLCCQEASSCTDKVRQEVTARYFRTTLLLNSSFGRDLQRSSPSFIFFFCHCQYEPKAILSWLASQTNMVTVEHHPVWPLRWAIHNLLSPVPSSAAEHSSKTRKNLTTNLPSRYNQVNDIKLKASTAISESTFASVQRESYKGLTWLTEVTDQESLGYSKSHLVYPPYWSMGPVVSIKGFLYLVSSWSHPFQ